MKKYFISILVLFAFAFPALASTYSSSGYVSYSNPVVRFIEYSDPSNGYIPDGSLVATAQQVSNFVGYVVTFDSSSSGDWVFDTYTDCHLDSQCNAIYLNTASAASVSGDWPQVIRIFVFPSDSDLTSPVSSCFTGTYSDCVFDMTHTQVIDFAPSNGSTECSSYVAGNGAYDCVLSDSSVLDQSAQQLSVGGDSFSPFIFMGGIVLFFMIIAFIIKWLRSKV